jgi:hypothetical protein
MFDCSAAETSSKRNALVAGAASAATDMLKSRVAANEPRTAVLRIPSFLAFARRALNNALE